MSLAVSSERTHCSVGPRRAQMDATVVPQEPPPRTTTLGSRCAGAMPISVLPTAAVSPVVDELQRDVEVGLLQHGDDGLKVVALLGGTRTSSPWIWVLTPLGPSSRMSLVIFLASSLEMPCLMVPLTL